MKLIPQKPEGWWVPFGEIITMLTSTVFLRYTRLTDGKTDRRTDGPATAYSALSIRYAVAR